MRAERALEIGLIDRIPASARREFQQWTVLTIGLGLMDALALVVAFGLAYLIRFKTGWSIFQDSTYSIAFYSSVAFWVIPIWLLILAVFRLYDRHFLYSGFQEYVRVANACTAGMMVVMVFSFMDPTLILSRGWVLMTWVLSILSVSTSRFAARRVLRILRARGVAVNNAIIVGANEEGRALAEQIMADRASGIRIVGFVDTKSPVGSEVVDGVPVLSDLDGIEAVVRDRGAQEIIVATTALPRQEFLDLYRMFGRDPDVQIRFSSGLFEILTTGVTVQEVSSVSLMTPQRFRITGFDAALKQTVDYVGALVGLIALSPIFAVLALLVRLDSPGPIFHRRRVLGRAGTMFDALKFRTMVVDADEVLATNKELREAFSQGFKLKNDPRVTRVGRILRRTSLDELPQMINVLRGEMSLVGPRMIIPEESIRYGKWQLNLLTVKPGITGPWQVQGRAEIPYDERVRLSMNYIRNYSIWLDLEILIRTVGVVLFGRGAY